MTRTDTKHRSRKRTATSDEDGNFSLPGLPEGTTTIKASHAEFADRALANVRLPTEKNLEDARAGHRVAEAALAQSQASFCGAKLFLNRTRLTITSIACAPT